MKTIIILAGILLIAGCGSSSKAATPSSTKPPGTSGNSDTTPSTAASSDTTVASSGGSSVIPQIPDGTWSKGRIHVEVSGDKASNFESDGSGATVGGVTSAAYAQNVGSSVSLGFGRGEDGAISVTTESVSTVGTFGKDCDITFTKHDAAGLAAEFTCTGLSAVDTSTTVYKIDVKGNFTLAP